MSETSPISNKKLPNSYFPHLFSRGHIGKMQLKNRIIMSPMGSANDYQGYPTEEELDYYEYRAKGGIGLIITEGQVITSEFDPWNAPFSNTDTDLQMKGWCKLADRVHAYNTKLCIQLVCGTGRNSPPIPGKQLISASENPGYWDPSELTRPLTTDEIHGLVACFGRATERAVRAKADCVEIHAHTGYTIDQFMTPLWNRRTDEYGGSFENRMRFMTEIVQAIRKAGGPDFPIIARISLEHDFEGGRTVEEGQEIVRYLEKIGVDAVDIDRGAYDKMQWIIPANYHGESALLSSARAAKQVASISVINAGTHTLFSAEKALAEQDIDFAMFGRSVIADPDFVNKAQSGNADEIRPCLLCNQYCVGRFNLGLPITCAVNAQAGSEKRFSLTKVSSPKNVLVIGGGPAGMEAARVAAVRGHKVTLAEKTDVLGGQIRAAATPPFKKQLNKFIEWQQRQLKANDVNVLLHTTVSDDSYLLREADEIIVATGALPIIPKISGIENAKVVEVTDAHLHPEKIKGENILVAGGGLSGCDYALEQAMLGEKVTIVEQLREVAVNEPIPYNHDALLSKLKEYNVTILTNTTIKSFTDEGVSVSDGDGKTRTIQADTVILSFGTRPDNRIAKSIYENYQYVQVIGDGNVVGRIGDAVRQGFFAGYAV